MEWLHYVSYFFAGLFLTNAVPHMVSALQGRAFQSPFAKPPGEGLSSSMVNFWWGFFNLGVGYLLLCRVGAFDLHAIPHIAALAAGIAAIGMQLSHHFGKFHGGNLTPQGKN